jgi:hypothetical protein
MDRITDVDAAEKNRISTFVENQTSIHGHSSRSIATIVTELPQIYDDSKDVFY